MKCYHFDDDTDDLEMLRPRLESCWEELRQIVHAEMGLDDPGKLFIYEEHNGPKALKELGERAAEYQLCLFDLMDVANAPEAGALNRGSELAEVVRTHVQARTAVIALSRAEQSVVHVGRVRREFEKYARMIEPGPSGTWGCGYLNKAEVIIDDDHPGHELTDRELAKVLIPILMDAGAIDTKVAVENLRLDPENFRLAGVAWEALGVSTPTESDIIRLFWDELDAEELARSMAAQGFWENEPLYVLRREGGPEQPLLVLEGNRRLAAVKGLLDPEYRRQYKIQVDDARLESLKRLPVIHLTANPNSPERKRFEHYIAFRHINSSLRWGEFAQASYISKLVKGELHGQGERKSLADLPFCLGDTFGKVPMLYRAYQVLDQAERSGVFNRRQRANYPDKLAFAQLVYGLQRPGVVQFLGMESSAKDARDPVPDTHLENLRLLMRWVFGDREEKLESLMTPADDWGNLEEILLDPVAVARVKDGASLSAAMEDIQPTSSQLSQALVICEQSLVEIKELLPLVGHVNALQHDIAANLVTLADHCRDTAKRISSGEVRLGVAE